MKTCDTKALRQEIAALRRLLRAYYRLHDTASDLVEMSERDGLATQNRLVRRLVNCATAYNKNIEKYPHHK